MNPCERFPFLDTETAMSYCSDDTELLEELLQIFCEDTDTAGLNSMVKEGRFSDYLIKVHALKNNARSIGATDLSEQAKALEMAARAGDHDFIVHNHPALDTACEKLINDIHEALK